MSTAPSNTFSQRCLNAVREAAQRWKTFWFDPADAFTLGMIRVLTGSMLVYNLLVWGLDLHAFFARDGLQPLAAITQFHRNDLVISLFRYVSDEWLQMVHCGCVIVAILFCLGVATRLTSVLAFLITISYSQRVPVANFGLDQILGMLCLYLALGPSGAALSVDQWLRRYWNRSRGCTTEIRKSASARMALRLIQIHMCVIYFWAGFAKLKGDTWWTGEAMWQVMANQEYQTLDLTWMAWVPWLPYLIAHVTVAWEVFFCVLVWNRHLRPLMLAIGTGMHLGIGAFLGMWTFGLIMTYGYFAFADPEWWRSRLTLSRLTAHGGVARGHEAAGETDIMVTAHASLTADDAVNGEHVRMVSLLDEANAAPQAETGPSPFAAGTEVLLVALPADERNAIRAYLRRHDIPCRAATATEAALSMLLKMKPAAILISGSQMNSEQVVTLVDDVSDLVDVPVLLLSVQLLSGRRLRRAHVLPNPISLRQLRETLTDLVLSAGNASPQAQPRLSRDPESAT